MRHNMQDFRKGGPVILVAADGVARVSGEIAARERGAERARVAAILSRAVPPEECGDRIPVAPARGPMMTFIPREMVRTEAGNWRSMNAGYLGRRAARVADAFDLMTRAALKAQTQAGRDQSGLVPPFSVGQVEIGREYAALTERVESSGLGCVSLEASGGGSGGGSEGVQAAVFRDLERLRMLWRRIGSGLAKDVRRIRPGGVRRRAIRVRDLVDAVCLKGQSLETVLRAHGWPANGRERDGLRTALCSALDRMRGFDLVRPTK